jgi:ABC-2 type transport system permease protein
MKQLNIILKIWYEELVDVFQDRGVLIFILFVPICYPLLYSYVYTNEVVREVPIVAVDNSNSSLSRQLLRNIDSSPDVKIIHWCGDMEEARSLVRKSRAYGIIRIPRDIGKDNFLGDQSVIGVYCDMSSMLYYKAIVLAATNTSLAMNEELKIEEHLHGTTDREDKINRLPIQYEQMAIFNSQSGFASFLIPPVLMLIIQQTLLLGVGMSTGRIRERNMGCIIPLRKLYKDGMNIVLGRSLFYFMIYFIMAIYMFTYVNKTFALPLVGQYGTFLAFIVPYLLSCIFFAMVLSVFVYRREDCIMLFVFISVPMLFISGISWPGSALPHFWKVLSYIFPSTFGMNGYVRICSMGATLEQVAFEYRGLWIQAGVYFLLACLFYNTQIFKLRKRLRK